jgi:hypothetical protein
MFRMSGYELDTLQEGEAVRVAVSSLSLAFEFTTVVTTPGPPEVAQGAK